ncbi:MAG: hypothetical protein KF795_01580 [Labilithrix sp.]|nr:hypothetical protein [Labilithrix sp.]
MRRAALVGAGFLFMIGCGADGASGGDTTTPGGGDGTGGDRDPGASSPGGPGSNDDPSNADTATELTGVWSVSGKDARGAYQGQAEVRSAGGKLQFIRSIRYDAVKVEDGRALHWTVTGEAKGDPKSELALEVVLDNRGFIAKRGDVEHKLADAPIAVGGKVVLESGKGKASYNGAAIAGNEVWQKRTANGAEPIFAVSRTISTGHAPPSALTKQAFWSTYTSFRALPAVAPYVTRPEFDAAVHGHIVDTTDFAFYRANPDAIRVVSRSIDAISTQEALARANAYRKTLAEKATGFDHEIEAEFIEPTTGMLLDAAPAGQPKEVHFSAALWTGIYMASQVYRFEVTGDAKAKANAMKALDGILKLQEVTGNWKVFARAIRPQTGNTGGGWHAGAGALSNLEWLEGGNNDMMKGLYIAYVLGHRLLCLSGSDPLCARIRTNARHLADDVNVDRGSDELDSAWLTAVVTSDVLTKAQYQAKAEVAWTASKVVITNNTTLYEQGTADWSGLNLGFVGNVFHMLLADRYNVGGDAKAAFKGVIADVSTNLKKQRLPLWNLLGAAYSGQPPDKAAADDVLWRLREMPFPKPVHHVDHRINPDFCMSPYPALPWKNDWTTTDRTQALRSVPLFEEALDTFRFRTEMRYAGDIAARPPAPEYLIAYWFGRKHGLIPATE